MIPPTGTQTTVPPWLTAGGTGVGGSVKVLDDIKDCLCNNVPTSTGFGPSLPANIGAAPQTLPYCPNIDQPQNGVNPINQQSENILGESPANFDSCCQQAAQDIDSQNAANNQQNDDVGIKIDALVAVAEKITTLPDQIGESVKAAIESAFGNLGNNTEQPAGEVVPTETADAGGTNATVDLSGTLTWGDTLTIEHNIPASTPPNLAAQITEIVNNILRDSGLIQGAGQPVQEGGITPTQPYA